MKLDLIIGAVILVVLAVLGAYIWGLNARIDALEATKVQLQGQLLARVAERDQALEQVRTLTQDAADAAQRQGQAADTIKKLQVQLAKKRSEVQTVTIPTECPDALDWLAQELK